MKKFIILFLRYFIKGIILLFWIIELIVFAILIFFIYMWAGIVMIYDHLKDFEINYLYQKNNNEK